eukprot:TRINITY_DN4331_c0_g1_i4.p1 TRINITY_DN4331_c0_g1~~TRINITY_DN4331_c0_g1_i4.p1  ORF type:complete len:1183 (+),score=146.93 TRINITY_DN4331_c0_g1_i4:53-3601(+)
MSSTFANTGTDRIRFKCFLGDDIQVLPLPKSITPVELLQRIEEEFGEGVLIHQYEDYEGDKVRVRSNSDLQEAIAVFEEMRALQPSKFVNFKLFLTRNGTQSSSGSANTSISSSSGSVGVPIGGSGSSLALGANRTRSSSGSGGGAMLSTSPSPPVVGIRSTPPNHILNGIISGVNVLGGSSDKLLHFPSDVLSLIHPQLHSSAGSNSSTGLDSFNASNHSSYSELPPLRTPPRSPSGSPGASPQISPRNHLQRPQSVHMPHPLNNIHTHTNHNSHSSEDSIPPIRTPPGSPRRHSKGMTAVNPPPTNSQGDDLPPLRTPPPSPRASSPSTSPRADAGPSSPRYMITHTQTNIKPSRPEVPDFSSYYTRSDSDHSDRTGIKASPDPRPVQPAPSSPQASPAFPPTISTPPLPVALPSPSPSPSPMTHTTTHPQIPTSLSDLIGHTPYVRWQRVQLLGRGGFGSVYLGLTATGGLVAVKQLDLDGLDDPRTRHAVAALAKEVEVMRPLNHSNIVRYLGTQIEDGEPDTDAKSGDVPKRLSVFLEYMPGGSIASLIAKFGPLSESVVRSYTRQILQGLAYLHMNQIAHRDIKGANILLDSRGAIKLADFGCSRLVMGIVSQFRTILGTPFWMAPEVIKQSGHGRAADIWSLGCVIIEMATGSPPWSHISEIAAVMYAIANGTEPPDLPASLSSNGHDFLRRCFLRDPKERPDALALLSHPFVAEDTSTPTPDQPNIVPPTPTAHPQSNTPLHTTAQPTASILELPTALILCIFKHIEHMEDLARAATVCSLFKTVCHDEGLWRALCGRSGWFPSAPQMARSPKSRSGSVSVPSTPTIADGKGVVWRALYISRSRGRRRWIDEQVATTQLKGHNHTRCVIAPGTCDTLISAGDDNKIKLWDLRKGKATHTLKGHSGSVLHVDSDSGCQRIFTASADRTAKIWDGKNRKVTRTYSHTAPVTCVGLFTDEADAPRFFTCASDHNIRIWDTENSAAAVLTIPHPGVQLAKADRTGTASLGGLLASISASESVVRIWDIRTGVCVRELTGHHDPPSCLTVHGQLLVSGGPDGQIRVSDIGTGRCVASLLPPDALKPSEVCAVHMDQEKLVSGGRDRLVRVWDVSNGQCVRTLKGHTDTINTIYADDGHIFSASFDKSICMWTLKGSAQPAPSTPSSHSGLRGWRLGGRS